MADESVTLAEAPAGVPALQPAAPTRKHSYRDILSSSAVIGGSSAINVVIGMVRTKAMALLLGPTGFGVMGAYMQLVELARNVAQMGLGSSGVRQIADAVASGDDRRVALTVMVLRRLSLVCALTGAVLMVVLSAPISSLTFGSDDHAGAVALLAAAVFLSVVAGSQGALLQGMRRIADMARIAVLGGLLGTLVGIPMVYVFGEAGLASTLVVMAALSLLMSWWYSRSVPIQVPTLDGAGLRSESAAMLKLGLAFMASGLLMNGAAYAVRVIVLRKSGLDAAGIYTAAWTLGGLYSGFVLQAMGTDFYPRLVGVVKDHEECNRVVNEQARVSLLLAVPGVLATLTAAPLVITLFYSSQFGAAVEVLRWICLGMAVRVLTWPIGYIVLAKNVQLLFFCIELAWAATNVGLTWVCVEAFGVAGAGMAFLASNTLHAVWLQPVVRHLSGFRWSAENLRAAGLSFVLVTAVFSGFRMLPLVPATALGITLTIASTLYSIRTLTVLVAPQQLPPRLQRLLRRRPAP